MLFHSSENPTIERFEMDTGHGKRQAYLDLVERGDAATLRDLIRGADVCSQGFQHGSLARRGLSHEQLAELCVDSEWWTQPETAVL